MKKLIIGIILFAGVFVGYKVLAANGWVRVSSQVDWAIRTDNNGANGIRFHDDEKNATCWTVQNGALTNQVMGISCLPDKQLK